MDSFEPSSVVKSHYLDETFLYLLLEGLTSRSHVASVLYRHRTKSLNRPETSLRLFKLSSNP